MLDNIDKELIKQLQENGKKTIKELAQELHLTTSPIFERIKRLEKEGYIKGYTAIVDNKKVGKGQVVLCNLILPNHSSESMDAFAEEVLKMPEVLECFSLTGEIDFQMKVLVRDLDEYYDFLKKFDRLNLMRVHSSMVVLKKLKSTTTIVLS